MTQWEQAQEWEKSWWKNCSNTVWEDVKQIGIAPYLGLKVVPNEYTEYRIPLQGQSVLDIGGGPSSLLLKCENYKPHRCTVLDPCDYPEWVTKRYESADIYHRKIKGEDFGEFIDFNFDEVWIYNCLQHTEDPAKIIENAKKHGEIIRLFEWINHGTNAGHLYSFTKEWFDRVLGGEGKTVKLNSNGLYGEAYYGIFLGDSYNKEAKE